MLKGTFDEIRLQAGLPVKLPNKRPDCSNNKASTSNAEGPRQYQRRVKVPVAISV